MRILAAGIVVLALGACASPVHQVAEADSLLDEPRGVETLSETILREGSSPNGCLAPGNAGQNRREGILGNTNPCRDLAELIAPPPLPEPPPPPPPLPINR